LFLPLLSFNHDVINVAYSPTDCNTPCFAALTKKVDSVIDGYFENIVGAKSCNFDKEKYKAWLVLFSKDDSKESKNEFLLFMQHEMQHKKEKTLKIKGF